MQMVHIVTTMRGAVLAHVVISCGAPGGCPQVALGPAPIKDNDARERTKESPSFLACAVAQVVVVSH
jgi:hypothetical protein